MAGKLVLDPIELAEVRQALDRLPLKGGGHPTRDLKPHRSKGTRDGTDGVRVTVNAQAMAQASPVRAYPSATLSSSRFAHGLFKPY